MVFGSKCTCFFLLQMVQSRNSAAPTIKKNKIYTLMGFFFIALQWIGDPLVAWQLEKGPAQLQQHKWAVLNLNLPDFPFNIIFFCVYELL